MEKDLKLNISFKLLKISVVLVFLGRAWQFIFWDAPFRTFFWNESLLKPFIESVIGIDWKSYANSPKLDVFIDTSVFVFGIIYLLSVFAVIFYSKIKKIAKYIIISGTIGLILLAYLLMSDRFYQLAQFFEYSIQFSIPLIFVFYQKQFIQRNLILILKVLIATVFIAHGLYAVGYYPVPGLFLGMVIDILGFSEQGARNFLLLVGILDFVGSILIFVPKIAKYVLIYLAIWGFLTSFARLVAGFSFDFFWELLHLNLYQTVYRLPHGILPLMLLLKLKDT
ncbi:hypothetical protein MHL31_00310 [Lutibacter sp. A80]|uniref:hypothetical protein n=1 Tax=Lutibacter sp. A80 TaxID=2918453 RepID=UPI001F062C56|nr:hypothetical protein [Lutibacter sp. A80]UMB60670.1 hypothetical protein MHL31_00310 [Lutibacter sp. A80]